MFKFYQSVFEIRKKVSGTEECNAFLLGLAKILGMHVVAVNSQSYPTLDGRGGMGITATVYFTESYAAIDTWPKYNFVHLNIVSCKKYDIEKVKKFIKNSWKNSRIEKITTL